MSKYTIELKTLNQLFTPETVLSWFMEYNLTDYLTSDEIAVINARGTWTKERLAKKIVRRYATREIGFETPALFREMVKGTMDGIMEEYLPLIYSASIKYDPLVNVDFTETFTRERGSEFRENMTGNSTAASSSRTNGNGLAVNSDTPQGQINKTDILNGRYASSTSATENLNIIDDDNTVDTTQQRNTNDSENENYTRKTKGNSGVSATAQKMIEQYRQNIIAIDREIVEKLNVLFMGVY